MGRDLNLACVNKIVPDQTWTICLTVCFLEQDRMDESRSPVEDSIKLLYSKKFLQANGRIQRGGETGGPPPEKLQKYKGLSNTGLDPLKNHKATKPAFNVRP